MNFVAIFNHHKFFGGFTSVHLETVKFFLTALILTVDPDRQKCILWRFSAAINDFFNRHKLSIFFCALDKYSSIWQQYGRMVMHAKNANIICIEHWMQTN